MGSMNCMNEVCRATMSSEWKKGWSLKSGEFATLCYNCGSAYENSVFCETFHTKESGWRECRICGKLIHCGCIASRYQHEYMDFGGIGCASCAKHLEIRTVQSIQNPGDISTGQFATNGIEGVHPLVAEHKIADENYNNERLLQLTKSLGANDVISKLEQLRREESMLNLGESHKLLPNLGQHCSSAAFVKADNSQPKQGIKNMNEYLAQTPLNFSLATNFGNSSSVLPFPTALVEGSKQSKNSFQSGQRMKHILPKPLKHIPVSSETDKGITALTRVARPPAEGRGRSQPLPRYWPKISDQELRQLSGDLKSSIVPLFEKILSASDAGRIGRLVLPKACAEAYFPAINQSEGIPIKIQDIKGKHWTFQFRFWPNNNSRMYVLEGVTPCIQNMQVQAGDIVTFSRINPGGQLVIGCRKATNNGDVQNGGRTSEDLMQQHRPMPEKNMRNIKNKRLLMHSDDAVELRITWEEAQELLQPSPSAQSTIVMVDEHEFEEFDEPPIFGKRTFFTSRPSGKQEQLAQCDSCSKWRRLPVHALLSTKWTCSDNIWDSNRCSCSAQEDIDLREMESFLTINKEFRKRRVSDSMLREEEPSGLDALATIAVLGDNISHIGESSAVATTRHPRHRPGCTCIVCIQPPSGKGKHEPTCKCNVCSTVKRRFKTLMMRKKKRQSEREAELAQEKDKAELAKICLEREEDIGHALLNMDHHQESENGNKMALKEAKMEHLDLNCDPLHDDFLAADEMSLMTLMNVATALPLDVFSRQSTSPSVGQSLQSREENAANGVLFPGVLEQVNIQGDGQPP